MDKQVHGLLSQADELQKKQAGLDILQEQLAQVDELSKRAGWQLETLKESRQDLDVLRKEIQAFYKAQSETSQLRDKIAADRTAFEGFFGRVDEFKRTMPELDSRIDAISSKLSVVDEGTQKAANLVAIADDLDREMTRIAGHQQFVEKVEVRLNTLNTLSGDVDRKIEEQLGRRAEVEALKSLCDGVSLQVTDAQQKLGAVGTLQHKLLPLTAQMATLKGQIDKVHGAFKEARQDETAIAAQEKRLAELVDTSRAAAREAGERLKQVEALSAELARSTLVKNELVEELTRAQGRQRDVGTHMVASEDQLKRLENQFKQVDQRRSQVAFAEKKIVAVEDRIGDLRSMTEEVERKIQGIAARGVHRGREEGSGDGPRDQRSQQSRPAARDRTARRRRSAQSECGKGAERIGETEERMAVIESRRKVVSEVQLKTNVMSHMLADVRLNLETLSEQKSVIDHVIENLAGLNEMVQGTQATLKALQTERELAERIERGNKQLRIKTGDVSDGKRSA